MPPIFNNSLCTGCGACEDTCPLDVIYMDEHSGHSYAKYPEECWHCGSCRQECPAEAIQMRFPLRILVPAGVVPY